MHLNRSVYLSRTECYFARKKMGFAYGLFEGKRIWYEQRCLALDRVGHFGDFQLDFVSKWMNSCFNFVSLWQLTVLHCNGDGKNDSYTHPYDRGLHLVSLL